MVYAKSFAFLSSGKCKNRYFGECSHCSFTVRKKTVTRGFQVPIKTKSTVKIVIIVNMNIKLLWIEKNKQLK